MPLIEKRHDHGLWLSILKQGHTAYGLKEVLGKYRIRDGSISNNKIDNIKYQWRLYREIEKLNIIKSIYYMSFYAYHGIKKHGRLNWNIFYAGLLQSDTIYSSERLMTNTKFKDWY